MTFAFKELTQNEGLGCKAEKRDDAAASLTDNNAAGDEITM